MNKKLVQIIGVVLFCSNAFGQVTSIGNDTLLDVAGWNVEWFGDATNGPSDEALQYTNVKSVLKNTNIDVWGLAEVSNPTTFTNLLTDLPLYDGVLSSFSQTQKTALIWKKSKFDVLSSGNILTESTYNYDFAGRPPLEVVLKSKDNNITDTIYFYVLHLKAYADQTSYGRRKNAAGFLKTYLDQNRKGKKCIVLGDWNDDIDESIVYVSPAYLESPFLNFVNDSSHYFYTTMALSKAGENSYVSSQNMIDQQLITSLLRDSFYVRSSCSVLKQTAGQVPNYSTTTSDHYPVLARYNMKRYFKPVPPPTGIEEYVEDGRITVYPNPAQQQLFIQSPYSISSVKVVNTLGEVVWFSNTATTEVDVKNVSNGLYYLVIAGEMGSSVKRIQVQR